MAIPTIFSDKGSNNLVSYPAIDVIEGVSLVPFYAGGTADNAGIKYRLDRNTFNCSTTSNTVKQTYTNGSEAGAAFVKVIDLDFDTSVINVPTILGGTMFSNIPIGTGGAGAGVYPEIYAVAVLKKVASGGGETTISTGTSNTLVVSTSQYSDTYFAFSSSVPKTAFKIGEKIRVTIEIWLRNTGVGTALCSVAHNPMGDLIASVSSYPAFTAGNTILKVILPFKIDL